MDTPPVARFRSRASLTLALVLTLGALALSAGSVAAGETVPAIDFRIVKVDCDEAPGDDDPPISEQLPEGCAYVEGVTFTIEVEGGETLECTTGADGRCMVQVPSESMVTVTEDESTGTAGYSPIENPIETQAVTEFAGAQFINVRDEKPPTTDLPDTGAGPVVTSATHHLQAGLLAAFAMLLAVGGVALRPARRR